LRNPAQAESGKRPREIPAKDIQDQELLMLAAVSKTLQNKAKQRAIKYYFFRKMQKPLLIYLSEDELKKCTIEES
jgi:hypothetical protein